MKNLYLLIFLLTIIGCKKSNNSSNSFQPSIERQQLFNDLNQVVPAFDTKRLTTSIDSALVKCSDHELEQILTIFNCHDEYENEQCSNYDENRCFAEPTDDCIQIETPLSPLCLEHYYSELNLNLLNDENSLTNSRSRTETLSSMDCEESILAANLASISYEDPNIQSHLTDLNSEFILNEVFRGDIFYFSQLGLAYLATLENNCYVVYRGSSTSSEWYNDFLFANTDCLNLDGNNIGKCHYGFYQVYDELRSKGLNELIIQKVNSNECSDGLTIIGHSLGAAEASLLLGDLNSLDPQKYQKPYVNMITFGEPRSWENDVANKLDSLFIKYRWTNWGDPVPSGPPTVAGYLHYGSAWETYKNWSGYYFIYPETQNFQPYPLNPLNHKMVPYIDRISWCRNM